MSKQHPSRLRFNFGFLLETANGTSRTVELNFPTIKVSQDVILTPLTGHFQTTRVSEGVYVSGKLHSTLSLECVRCLKEAIVPIIIALDDMYYYPPETAPAGEFVIGEDGFADLAPLVRELALLDVPIRPLCKPGCQGLCMECGQNLNERDCGCQEDEIDPRLAALRQLLE